MHTSLRPRQKLHEDQNNKVLYRYRQQPDIHEKWNFALDTIIDNCVTTVVHLGLYYYETVPVCVGDNT
jgi:hypothetical protein